MQEFPKPSASQQPKRADASRCGADVSAEDRQEEDKEGPTLAISEVTKKGLCATRLHKPGCGDV